MDHFQIRPVTEADVTEIVRTCGGERAHPDQDRRSAKGGDYICDGAAIELKLLDEDGLEKATRQRKLATLFCGEGFGAPVVVLDRENLSQSGQRAFDRAIEGPIKGDVASARKQLKQTRAERPDTTFSILWVINNGYTALNHEELTKLVAHRVRNDTTTIDGVIVGGCYFHSDGFDHFFLWPLSYIPITLDTFGGFAALHSAWGEFANRFMSRALVGEPGEQLSKGPVIDSQFEVDDVTFVKPAPPIGGHSEFFRYGRPRKDSSGLSACPPVAFTFPGLTRTEWNRFRNALPDELDLFESYDGWIREQAKARDQATALQPLVPISIDCAGWRTWCSTQKLQPTMGSVRSYANAVFQDRIQATIASARELKKGGLTPARYIFVVTEEIGQDKANDLSHLAKARQRVKGEPDLQPIVEDLRIFREHAIALASAYAIAEGFESVMWMRRGRYAWA